MPKTSAVFYRINQKAATITGAVIGFFGWLGMMPYMSAGYPYGMMGYMMGYSYSGFGLVSVVIGAILGAIAGFVIAAVYNWALGLK